MQSRLVLVLLILFLGYSCARDKAWPLAALNSDWPYKTIVYINNEGILKDIGLIPYQDSLLSLALTSATTDGLLWKIAFGKFSMDTQTVALYKLVFPYNDSMYAWYYAMCCVPPYAEFPDVTVYQYSIWEPDSVNNFLHVDVDTSTKELSGNFKCTFVNDNSPFDTIRMYCDEFYCKWD